jgi:hypothetical protein
MTTFDFADTTRPCVQAASLDGRPAGARAAEQCVRSTSEARHWQKRVTIEVPGHSHRDVQPDSASHFDMPGRSPWVATRLPKRLPLRSRTSMRSTLDSKRPRRVKQPLRSLYRRAAWHCIWPPMQVYTSMEMGESTRGRTSRDKLTMHRNQSPLIVHSW